MDLALSEPRLRSRRDPCAASQFSLSASKRLLVRLVSLLRALRVSLLIFPPCDGDPVRVGSAVESAERGTPWR